MGQLEASLVWQECNRWVLHNNVGEMFIAFSMHIAVKDFDEAEVLDIFKLLRIYQVSFHGRLIVE